MLHKTRGIVFRTTDYSDTSVVVQIFTEKFGNQSYLINGVKRPRARIRMNMLQPLHLLDMVVYHKESGNIQRVSELRPQPVFQTIPYDIARSAVAMFLNEVLYKTIRQHDADPVLFEFLFHALEILDSMDEGVANFHLYFLLRLTRFLGFYPDLKLSHHPYFDLKDGVYRSQLPPHIHVLEAAYTPIWTRLLNARFSDLPEIRMSAEERKMILQKILEFYQLHIEGFGNIHSHEVLEAIFS